MIPTGTFWMVSWEDSLEKFRTVFRTVPWIFPGKSPGKTLGTDKEILWETITERPEKDPTERTFRSGDPEKLPTEPFPFVRAREHVIHVPLRGHPDIPFIYDAYACARTLRPAQPSHVSRRDSRLFQGGARGRRKSRIFVPSNER